MFEIPSPYLCSGKKTKRKEMMNVKLLLAGAVIGLSMPAIQAQEKVKEKEDKGKPIIQVFGNFHTGFGSANDERGFELDRSYLGYQYKLNRNLEIKAVMDVGKSSDVDDMQRIAYIKNAQLKWTTGKLTLSGGLISTTLFKVQEDFWGYRYMRKVMQDQYGFGSSADLGITADYRFTDWISADVMVVNGEGYKKIQKNDGLQYGIGTTIQPLKGLTIRLYGSLNEKNDEGQKNSYLYAAFVGYQNDRFSLGAEYNHLDNQKCVDNQDLDGISVYTTVKLHPKWKAFARYDNLFSKNNWNASKDEVTYLGGVEFKPCPYVKIAPNLRYYDAKGEGVKNRWMAYISCYFGI